MIAPRPEQMRISAGLSSGAVDLDSRSTPKLGPLMPPPPIPDHELLRCIGRGSYGDVWLARNVTGTYRAIKVVYRSSFDSDRPYEREFDGLRKFEPISRADDTQVDILHIGRGDGCFYYVMELADDASAEAAHFGVRDPDLYVPRTLKRELTRRGRLPAGECIDLGLALTRALTHLHSNGLIHRDIKPSNIIFIHGKPKLADIGLVADQDATCSFVGTEGYLPPEGPGTAPADLYSLGKVLYEASTGKDRREFPELPIAASPPAPGAIARGKSGQSPELSADEERELIELNAVMVKACKREARQRYQTATEMRDDLLLLLAGKSVRRTHAIERRLALMTRIGIATAAALVLCAIPMFLAIKEARRATAMAREEIAQRLRAQANEQRAEKEATKSAKIAESLKELIRKFGPSVSSGRHGNLFREMLDKTASQITRDLTNQPEAEVELLLTLAETFDDLGMYDRESQTAGSALQIAAACLGSEHPVTANARRQWGVAMIGLKQFKDAENSIRAALAAQIRVLGPDNLTVACSLADLGRSLVPQRERIEGEAVLRQALALRRKLLGEEHPDVSQTLSQLAEVLDRRLPEADDLYCQALEMQRKLLWPEHPYIARCLNNLANVLREENRLAEAESMLREVLVIDRKLWGDEHLKVAESIHNLGLVLRDENKLVDAEDCFRNALQLRRKLVGDADAATPLDNLADVLLREGKAAEAEQWISQMLTPAMEVRHDATGLFRARADFFARRSRWREAMADTSKVIEMTPLHHWHYFTMATMLAARGDAGAYRRLCHQIIETFKTPVDPGIAEVMAKSCLLLPGPGVDLAQVDRLASRAVSGGQGHLLQPWFEICKGLAEYRQGHFREALDWMQKLLPQVDNCGANFAVELHAIRAMSEYQLNDPEQAQIELGIATSVAKKDLPGLSSEDLGPDWYDLLISHTLLREARSLILSAEPTHQQEALNFSLEPGK